MVTYGRGRRAENETCPNWTTQTTAMEAGAEDRKGHETGRRGPGAPLCLYQKSLLRDPSSVARSVIKASKWDVCRSPVLRVQLQGPSGGEKAEFQSHGWE